METTIKRDIVIIGSGAGGGTVAKTLAPLCQQGLKISLIEWGGRFRAHHNTRDEVEMARKYYFESGGFQNRTQDMTFAFAKAVGGSTTVYTGTSLRGPRRVIEGWEVPDLNYEDLEPRYDKYILENNVHCLPDSEVNENNRLFMEGCTRMNWRVEKFPVNVRDCAGLGTCNLGCSLLAKQGTAVVQIPAAERQGVEVMSYCRAESIGKNEVMVQVFPPEPGMEPSLLSPGRYRIQADRIIVAAGAVHSPALLMHSFGAERWPALGRYFTCHPALILAAQHPRPIVNTVGHPKSFFCDEFLESQRFLLETCMYFPFTLGKSLAGFGEDLDQMMAGFDRLQMILALVVDEARPENRIAVRRDGSAEIHYEITPQVIEAASSAIRACAEIFFAAGAERVHSPVSERFFIERKDRDRLGELINARGFKRGKVSVSAAHLMGGCRMGRDPASSVTDGWGRLHGEPGIYVADASLFPSALEVNPYLTIMALADRVAEAVREDLKV